MVQPRQTNQASKGQPTARQHAIDHMACHQPARRSCHHRRAGQLPCCCGGASCRGFLALGSLMVTSRVRARPFLSVTVRSSGMLRLSCTGRLPRGLGGGGLGGLVYKLGGVGDCGLLRCMAVWCVCS